MVRFYKQIIGYSLNKEFKLRMVNAQIEDKQEHYTEYDGDEKMFDFILEYFMKYGYDSEFNKNLIPEIGALDIFVDHSDSADVKFYIGVLVDAFYDEGQDKYEASRFTYVLEDKSNKGFEDFMDRKFEIFEQNFRNVCDNNPQFFEEEEPLSSYMISLDDN